MDIVRQGFGTTQPYISPQSAAQSILEWARRVVEDQEKYRQDILRDIFPFQIDNPENTLYRMGQFFNFLARQFPGPGGKNPG